MNIQMMSKKGSNAAKVIYDNTNVKRVGNKVKVKPALLINYGVSSNVRQRLLSSNKLLNNVPVINAFCCYNKYKALSLVSGAGVNIPDSKRELGKKDKPSEWLMKKDHSIGGKGIKIAIGKKKVDGRYYQRYVSKRKYEVRVHAFSWINKENWVIQRRSGDSKTIAWNFSNGGRFSTIHNRNKVTTKVLDYSEKVLKKLKMEFGAIDLIVDENDSVYFIEINSSPGMNGLSDSIYINAFKKLFTISIDRLIKSLNH